MLKPQFAKRMMIEVSLSDYKHIDCIVLSSHTQCETQVIKLSGF